MPDEKLVPEEFERLFGLDLHDYLSQLPAWIRQVEPVDVREGCDELLAQLRAAHKKTKKLEHVLQSHNVPVPQDIPYVVAKQKVLELQQRIMGGDCDENTYLELCAELEKYSTAMMASDEYHDELRRAEAKWEEQHRAENVAALRAIRRHMPVRVRFLSEDALVGDHKLPRPIARKFKRTDILSLIRKAPGDVERMHPGILENLKTAGLTLTERRALYEHLRTVGPKWIKAKDEMTQRKAQWYNNFKAKFKESADEWYQHKTQYGPPGAGHSKCNKIGMQCPFKADAAVDYSRDYGFPTGDEYEQDTVTKAPAPFVKEGSASTSNRNLNPAAAAMAAAAARPTRKPSFLGELSKKPATHHKSPLTTITTTTSSTKTASPAVHKPPTTKEALADSSKQNVLKEIKKKTPAEIAAEKAAQQAAQDAKKYAAKKAARDKILETHYKGKDDDLMDARTMCQTIQDCMDDMEALLEEWIDYVVRTDNKKLDQETIDDELWDFKDGVEPIRSVVEQYTSRLNATVARPSTVECELAEDLYLYTAVFFNFIQWRTEELKQKDKDLIKSIGQLQAKLKIMYAKNSRQLKHFPYKPERTRPIPSAKEMMETRRKKIEEQAKKKPTPVATATTPTKAPPLRNTSFHNKTAKDAASPKPKPSPPQRNVSFSSRTIEHQGKEHLKWQLVHQVNDAQNMLRRLETAITAAGLRIPDDTIPHREAEAKIAEISKRMAELSFQDPDYFKLEQEMGKYTAALVASDEYRRETERRERDWEAEIRPLNREALKAIRRHMPVDVRKMSEADLGSKIPVAMAKKFKRTNVLQLIRVNPNDCQKLHYSNFEGMSLSGMTLTERRALYEHLHSVGPQWFKQKSNEQTERKWMWFQSMKNKFRDDLKKYETHIEQFGPPNRHRCNFIGLQCPVKANQVMDYSGDFGFPDGPEYEIMEVAKEDLSYSQKRAKELRDQREADRRHSRGSFAPGIAAGIGKRC